MLVGERFTFLVPMIGHRTELVHREQFATTTGPPAFEHDRRAHVDPNRRSDHEHGKSQ
jgi:hypothetical protein